MRFSASALLIAAALTGPLLAGMDAAGSAPRTVAVTSIVQHPALDAVVEGLRKGLAEAGYTDGTDIAVAFESAQGNPATAAKIAERFVASRPALIVAISTPSAQAVAAASTEIPIVFSAVTDPVAARLVASLASPGGNVTGVSDMARIEDYLALIRELAPGVRRLGFLFNPDEANSVASRSALNVAAKTAGIALVDAAVRHPGEVEAATRLLVGRVDAIFAPTDNTVVQAFEAAAGIAIEAKLPLYAADTENVARGALAAIGVDYEHLGRLTAELADRVLKGEAPGTIPVVVASRVELHLNRATAEAIGIRLPQQAVDRAGKIVD